MASKKKKKVALIFGGTSTEREVSLVTAYTIAAHIDTKKYIVFPIEISPHGEFLTTSDMIKKMVKETKVKKAPPVHKLFSLSRARTRAIDVAFLALHGPGGEDGTVQGFLELLGIPYTCSGVLASALAMDKARTKRMLAYAGVPVLPHVILRKEDTKGMTTKALAQLKGQIVIKPNTMGSSLGIVIARDHQIIRKAIRDGFGYTDELLLEPYVQGREITIPVLGNDDPEVLPTVEIVPWQKSTFYDYHAKYQEGGSEHIIPAPLTKKLEKEMQEYALIAHQTLGCQGITRSDFILDEKGNIFFLEINTIPGMTPTSLAPQSAEAAGIDFEKFIDRLISLAVH